MAIELNPITSGYNLSKINENFQKTEDYINDKLLARADTGVAGEAKMERDLDMDGHSILNAKSNPDDPGSMITLEFADARYYNVDGDTLTGQMDVNGQTITNLPAPPTPTSPVRKLDLDAEASARQDADASLQDQLNGTNPPMGSAFSVISWHDQNVANSINIPANKNAWSFGPVITIDAGQTVTIGANSFWTVADGEVQP